MWLLRLFKGPFNCRIPLLESVNPTTEKQWSGEPRKMLRNLMKGHTFGTEAEPPLGIPTTLIGERGLHPNYFASVSSFLLMHTLVDSGDGSRIWILATHG